MVHNGIEYGLMQAYAEGFDIMQGSEFDLDLGEISGIWREGSVVRSWLLDLLHQALADRGNDLAGIAPYVEDSGEGRWTVFEAIAEDVPAPVITAALYARFASRVEESFAAKINAALGAVRRTRHQDRMTEVAENPLLQGLGPRRTPSPCALAVFGASGDLTRRKIFPALYSLACRRMLPEQFAVVGVAREGLDGRRVSASAWSTRCGDFGRDDFDEDVWEELAGATRYIALDFADEEGEDRRAPC